MSTRREKESKKKKEKEETGRMEGAHAVSSVRTIKSALIIELETRHIWRDISEIFDHAYSIGNIEPSPGPVAKHI